MKTARREGGRKEANSMNGMDRVLRMVVEIRETRNIKEVAAILATGKWLVIAAAMDGNGETCLFSLGRVA